MCIVDLFGLDGPHNLLAVHAFIDPEDSHGNTEVATDNGVEQSFVTGGIQRQQLENEKIHDIQSGKQNYWSCFQKVCI